MADSRSPRRNRQNPRAWLRFRKISQVFFLLVFGVFFLWSRREFYLNPALESGLKERLINLFLRLDPLVMIAQAIASRRILAGSLLALLTLVITFALGRVWCGWFCPTGTLLEWFPIRTWKKRKPSVPDGLRAGKYILLLVILFGALAGNLSLLFLDPLTILYRTITAAVWPLLDQIVTAVELALIRIPALAPAVGGFDSLIRPAIFPPFPDFYRLGWLYGGFFLGLIGLNLFAPRFYCRYLCPLGGLLGLLGKVSLVQCEVESGCSQCGICLPECPTGAILTGPQGVYCDPGECTMCLVCWDACPGESVSYPARFSKFLAQPYDINRRKALVSLGTAAIGVGLLESPLAPGKESPKEIRPPGVLPDNFLNRCIRCGECGTVCPTNAIQMAIFESGLDGFWTPVVIPRIGYCDYSCVACGQVCPVEAIPPLALEEKRLQVIGIAAVDQDRCLPWAEDTHCIVCEEMCPVPEKAISLTEIEIIDPEGNPMVLLRPEVIREDCIGCGICENKCPVSGPAAIQVFLPDFEPEFIQPRGS